MPFDATQMRRKCGAKITIKINRRTKITMIISVLIALVLLSVAPTSIATSDATVAGINVSKANTDLLATRSESNLYLVPSNPYADFYKFGEIDTAPRIINASVEPLKVRPGDVMTVIVEIDIHGISSVTADMGSIETISLYLANGSNYNGIWQGDWTVHELTKLCKPVSGTCPYDDIITKIVQADEIFMTDRREKTHTTMNHRKRWKRG